MTLKLQIFIAVIDVITLLYIGNMVRKRKLELKYALVWFLVAVLLLIFDAFPALLNGLTGVLGITLPINMLFFLGFGFILMIVFSQTIIISNLTRRDKRHTQEIALLNKKIDDLLEGEYKEKI